MRLPRRPSCYLLVAALLGCGVHPLQPDRPADNPLEDEFVDVQGNTFRFPGPHDCKAVVLLFVGYDCPISNSYTPEVLRICKEYAPQKVAFCVVYADADITKDDARQHAEGYGYTCPAILDPEMKLARKTGATVKPEAVVLSPEGELLYRGRINDLYIDFGQKRPQATTHDLKNALDAILAGKAVPVALTKAVGCYIDLPEKIK